YRRCNKIFAGIWFGFKKPECKTFLQPFAVSLKELFTTGIGVSVKGKKVLVKGILLSSVFDSPARCIFMELNQFNGFFGCPFCLTKGATVKTGQKGHMLAYPFNTDNSSTGHDQLRTLLETRQHAMEAFTKSQQGNSSAVMGVKGVSWFLHVPKFDMINGMGADYMHCVCLGITKMLLILWTDKTNKDNPWYVGNQLELIDTKILRIKPPHVITRAPRNIFNELSHWKASEFRNFLLFYSIPVLWKILPNEYFQHYCLLVEAIFILLQSSISPMQLKKAS
uniref:Uncharacterized protein LOC102800872 n=1 Tax=Saccoglossus kowalevskii TaxID=10224 RepID=A0ABM0N1J6_SACKO